MNSIKKLADIQCLINEAYSDKEPLTEEQKASKKIFNEYCEDIRKDLDVLVILKLYLQRSRKGEVVTFDFVTNWHESEIGKDEIYNLIKEWWER